MATKTIDAKFLASPAFKADPYPFYARQRREAPVFPVTVPFYRRAWLVTRYDDVVAMLKDDRLAKDISARMVWLPRFGRALTHHMLNRDPPDHTRLRSLVSRAFTPRRIEEMEGRIQSLCDGLLDGAARGGTFDLLEQYALPLPLNVISDLLGIPAEERRRFHAMVRGSLRLGAPTSVLDVPRALPYLWWITRYFHRLFAARRVDPREDLVTALVQAEDAGDRLSEDELLGMAMLLLFAGYETTVNLIGTGALELIDDPGQRPRLLEGAYGAERAVEELLRYTSPVEMTPPRVTREPVPMGGVTIPAGELVSAVLGSANRDEAQFAQADTLDLAREPNRHLALGAGPHFCLGASLARMEGRIALTTLFRRFPSLRLATSRPALRWRRMVPLRGLEALPVAT